MTGDPVPKYNIVNPVFHGPAQIGDGNQQLIDKFASFVDQRASHAGTDGETVRELFKELQRGIVQAPELDEYARVDLSNDLAHVAEEVAKPEPEQDPRGIRHYWSKVMAGVRDAGAVTGVAVSLGTLLGLPV